MLCPPAITFMSMMPVQLSSALSLLEQPKFHPSVTKLTETGRAAFVTRMATIGGFHSVWRKAATSEADLARRPGSAKWPGTPRWMLNSASRCPPFTTSCRSSDRVPHQTLRSRRLAAGIEADGRQSPSCGHSLDGVYSADDQRRDRIHLSRSNLRPIWRYSSVRR